MLTSSKTSAESARCAGSPEHPLLKMKLLPAFHMLAHYINVHKCMLISTVVSTKSDSDLIFCLQLLSKV